MSCLLHASKLTKEYHTGQETLQVLKGVDLELLTGEMLAVVGASGSGKTTLLQLLGSLDLPTSGEIVFNGISLLEKNGKELDLFRNRDIGFIFQFHHLLPDFTALENVMMPALIAGRSKAQVRDEARLLLEQVELGQRVEHKTGELSGGEQQRTALARALMMQPSLLLADEPTGNLDTRAGELVFELLNELCRKRGLATVMVTHNTILAAKMDRCLTLTDGRLEE